MAEKIQIKAVEMVRRIRHEQARMLAGRSKAGIIPQEAHIIADNRMQGNSFLM
jgi:hypothetical protein